VNPPTSSQPPARVAVVVIGRNEGERLRACLQSVLAMQHPALDLVYVDSASTDASVALAASLGARTIVLSGPTTAARGRNAGWRSTDAPYVLFLDGDTVLDPAFVSRNLDRFADPSIAGIAGDRRETRTDDSIYNAIFDLDWNAPAGDALYFGGDALVRRAALEAVGGYNERLIAGEEPDLCRRMRERGYRILHVAEPMTRHDLAMHHFRQYWRRSLRTGHAYAEVSSIYASTADPLWRRESRNNIARGLFWASAPLVSIGLAAALRSWLPLAAFGVTAGALIARTARKLRRRQLPPRLLLAYSLHSHLQQVPILAGQLRYWTRRHAAQRASLIEYKTTPRP
jgi:cellulose synthase/poly-beta-1,6-N-acetylglucosamine synthase-like glycosyltransferase